MQKLKKISSFFPIFLCPTVFKIYILSNFKIIILFILRYFIISVLNIIRSVDFFKLQESCRLQGGVSFMRKSHHRKSIEEINEQTSHYLFHIFKKYDVLPENFQRCIWSFALTRSRNWHDTDPDYRIGTRSTHFPYKILKGSPPLPKK